VHRILRHDLPKTAIKKGPEISLRALVYIPMRRMISFRLRLTVAVDMWQAMEISTALQPLALISAICLSRSPSGASGPSISRQA
jgi:hypothetical protein